MSKITIAVSVLLLSALSARGQDVSDSSTSDTELSPTTQPVAESAEASIDENVRFVPFPKPQIPPAQHPPIATTQNVDTDKPIHEWQRLTDDWKGVRPKLDDMGISFNANLTSDFSKNFTGGADTAGSAFRHLLNANVTLDTEKLFSHKGGTLFVNFQHQAGDNGAEKLTGDFQVISSIDADGRDQVSEFWFEQKIQDDKWRVKIGKIDANTEFSALEYAGEFVNGGFGGSTAILLPTYPDPATAICLFYAPSENISLGVGMFDGAAGDGIHTGENGPRTFFRKPLDWFLIAEANLKWKTPVKNLPGRLGVGVWEHTGAFTRFDGSEVHGVGGIYCMFEHALWRKNPDKEDDENGLSLFCQLSNADGNVIAAENHLRAGLLWAGPFESRADDACGLAATCSWFGRSAGVENDSELTIETFYKIQIVPFVSLKPDLQYIVNPGGIRSQDDALAFTLRVSVDF